MADLNENSSNDETNDRIGQEDSSAMESQKDNDLSFYENIESEFDSEYELNDEETTNDVSTEESDSVPIESNADRIFSEPSEFVFDEPVAEQTTDQLSNTVSEVTESNTSAEDSFTSGTQGFSFEEVDEAINNDATTVSGTAQQTTLDKLIDKLQSSPLDSWPDHFLDVVSEMDMSNTERAETLENAMIEMGHNTDWALNEIIYNKLGKSFFSELQKFNEIEGIEEFINSKSGQEEVVTDENEEAILDEKEALTQQEGPQLEAISSLSQSFTDKNNLQRSSAFKEFIFENQVGQKESADLIEKLLEQHDPEWLNYIKLDNFVSLSDAERFDALLTSDLNSVVDDIGQIVDWREEDVKEPEADTGPKETIASTVSEAKPAATESATSNTEATTEDLTATESPTSNTEPTKEELTQTEKAFNVIDSFFKDLSDVEKAYAFSEFVEISKIKEDEALVYRSVLIENHGDEWVKHLDSEIEKQAPEQNQQTADDKPEPEPDPRAPNTNSEMPKENNKENQPDQNGVGGGGSGGNTHEMVSGAITGVAAGVGKLALSPFKGLAKLTDLVYTKIPEKIVDLDTSLAQFVNQGIEEGLYKVKGAKTDAKKAAELEQVNEQLKEITKKSIEKKKRLHELNQSAEISSASLSGIQQAYEGKRKNAALNAENSMSSKDSFLSKTEIEAAKAREEILNASQEKRDSAAMRAQQDIERSLTPSLTEQEKLLNASKEKRENASIRAQQDIERSLTPSLTEQQKIHDAFKTKRQMAAMKAQLELDQNPIINVAELERLEARENQLLENPDKRPSIDAFEIEGADQFYDKIKLYSGEMSATDAAAFLKAVDSAKQFNLNPASQVENGDVKYSYSHIFENDDNQAIQVASFLEQQNSEAKAYIYKHELVRKMEEHESKITSTPVSTSLRTNVKAPYTEDMMNPADAAKITNALDISLTGVETGSRVSARDTNRVIEKNKSVNIIKSEFEKLNSDEFQRNAEDWTKQFNQLLVFKSDDFFEFEGHSDLLESLPDLKEAFNELKIPDGLPDDLLADVSEKMEKFNEQFANMIDKLTSRTMTM